MELFIMILASFVGGLIGGMGMGGGTLLIPLLTLFTSLSQQMAQSMNLLSFIPMSIVAMVFHIKNKLIEFPYLLLSIPALISSVLGSMLASCVDGAFLSKGFGVFLAVLGMVNIVATFIKKDDQFSKKNKND